MREIILEVCQIIWDELSSIYLSPPTEGEYERIIGDFYNNTGMPNVAGAIDGKHIRIKCPPHSGSQYFNYKKYHSIVLLAACDSNYVFSAVDVGAYGSQSDGGILKQSGFGNQILQGNINIPKTRKLPGTNVEFPCFFIGDAAFPLRHNIMRPYPGRLLPKDKELFNKKLSSARVKIENAFGILTAKFRILRNSLNMLPENAEKVVRATLVIHNFIRLNDSSNYFSSSFVDHINEDSEMVPGNWRNEVDPLPQCRMFTRFNASREAFSIRDTLKEYLNNVNI